MNVNLNLNSLTVPLRSLWEELVERRLWPLALALVVAIIAIPVVLSKPAKEAAPLPPAPAATGPNSPGVAFQPAVSTEGRKSSEIRKSLRRFTRKNPFTPQGLSAGGASTAGTAEPLASATGETGDPTGGGSPSGTALAPSGDSTGQAGTSPGTSSETFYYTYTVDVRFGEAGEPDTKKLSKFRALPSTANPVLIYMGVRSDGETAVFLVSASATTTGDGKCSPSDTECTFLYMKKGEKQTIEAVDGDGEITLYTLELLDVDLKRTTGPEKAEASSRAQGDGRMGLRRTARTFESFGF